VGTGEGEASSTHPCWRMHEDLALAGAVALFAPSATVEMVTMALAAGVAFCMWYGPAQWFNPGGPHLQPQMYKFCGGLTLALLTARHMNTGPAATLSSGASVLEVGLVMWLCLAFRLPAVWCWLGAVLRVFFPEQAALGLPLVFGVAACHAADAAQDMLAASTVIRHVSGVIWIWEMGVVGPVYIARLWVRAAVSSAFSEFLVALVCTLAHVNELGAESRWLPHLQPLADRLRPYCSLGLTHSMFIAGWPNMTSVKKLPTYMGGAARKVWRGVFPSLESVEKN